jgi:carboxymethylenebutenolidase
MDQKIITLFDRFTHGGMSRRDFMDRLTGLAGSAAAAAAILPMLENNYAMAQMVAADDARLTIEEVTLPSGIKGHLAMPKGAAKLPAVMVIHENRGLNPHIKDVTRRMALEGFLAFGPDFLTKAGGTPADADAARDMIGKLSPEETVQMATSVRADLAAHANSTGKVGAIGFCWGGGLVNSLAVADPALAAGVAYYGRQAPAADVAKITAPLMLHYASLDERINAGIAEYEAALKAAGKSYELHMYEGANHAFNNDTNEARYNKEAADLAWSRTVAFLKTHAGGAA